MQFKLPLNFGSTGTPLTLMTLNYFKNMYEVTDLLYISQAAQSRVSSASGTILIYSSRRENLLMRSAMPNIFSKMMNGSI